MSLENYLKKGQLIKESIGQRHFKPRPKRLHFQLNVLFEGKDVPFLLTVVVGTKPFTPLPCPPSNILRSFPEAVHEARGPKHESVLCLDLHVTLARVPLGRHCCYNPHWKLLFLRGHQWIQLLNRWEVVVTFGPRWLFVWYSAEKVPYAAFFVLCFGLVIIFPR